MKIQNNINIIIKYISISFCRYNFFQMLFISIFSPFQSYFIDIFTLNANLLSQYSFPFHFILFKYSHSNINMSQTLYSFPFLFLFHYSPSNFNFPIYKILFIFINLKFHEKYEYNNITMIFLFYII